MGEVIDRLSNLGTRSKTHLVSKDSILRDKENKASISKETHQKKIKKHQKNIKKHQKKIKKHQKKVEEYQQKIEKHQVKIAEPQINEKQNWCKTQVKECSNSTELNQCICNSKKQISLVQFFATWCKPCEAVSPLFDKLSYEYENIAFLKMNWDQSKLCRELYNVDSVPTFIFFNRNKEIARIVRYSDELYSRLKELLSNYNKEVSYIDEFGGH